MVHGLTFIAVAHSLASHRLTIQDNRDQAERMDRFRRLITSHRDEITDANRETLADSAEDDRTVSLAIILPAFSYRLVQCEKVLYGRLRLDVVDRIEDKAAAASEDFDPFAHFATHLVRSPKRKRLLGIDAPAPECKTITEPVLEHLRVHSGSRTLDRVQDIESRLDNIG